jgi:hypothetical protein
MEKMTESRNVSPFVMNGGAKNTFNNFLNKTAKSDKLGLVSFDLCSDCCRV